jgi:hypothetical protein
MRVPIHIYTRTVFFFSTVRVLSVLMMTINGSRAAVAVGVRCPVVSIMCSGPPGAKHRGYRLTWIDTLHVPPSDVYPAIPEGVTNTAIHNRVYYTCVCIVPRVHTIFVHGRYTTYGFRYSLLFFYFLFSHYTFYCCVCPRAYSTVINDVREHMRCNSAFFFSSYTDYNT